MKHGFKIGKTRYGDFFQWSPTEYSTLLSGVSGAGKSVLLYLLLAQVNADPRIKVVGIDPAGITLMPFMKKFPCDIVAGASPNDLEASLKLLENLVNEMDKRITLLMNMGYVDKLTDENMPFRMTHILLVLEEMPGFFTALATWDKKKKAQAEGYIDRILREGRKTGIRVLAVAQRAEANLVNNRSQYDCRITFRQDNSDSVKMILPDADPDIIRLTTQLAPGRCMIATPQEPITPLLVPYIDYADYAAKVTENNWKHAPLFKAK